MDDPHGDGEGAIGPLLWCLTAQEGAGSEPDVLDAWNELAGDWRHPILDFTVVRARMGIAAGPDWADFGNGSALWWREGEVSELPASLSPTMPPFPLGASLWYVEAATAGRLSLSLDADDAFEWGLVVVAEGTASTEIGRSLEVELAAAGEITVAVVQFGPADMDANDRFEEASFTLTVEPREEEGGGDTGDTDDTALAGDGGGARWRTRPPRGRTAAAATQGRGAQEGSPCWSYSSPHGGAAGARGLSRPPTMAGVCEARGRPGPRPSRAPIPSWDRSHRAEVPWAAYGRYGRMSATRTSSSLSGFHRHTTGVRRSVAMAT